MFLVLNTDLSVQEKLMDDINCGHIVSCAPSLSKDLLVELIWRLSLHKYTCESIIYCPVALGAELLGMVLDKIGSVGPLHALPIVEDISKAVYCKYIRLECIHSTDMKSAKSKLYVYLKNLLQYFVKPNLKAVGNNVNPQELYRLAGFAMRCILSLMLSCLKLYLDPLEQELDVSGVYDISLPEFCDAVESENKEVTAKTFIDELMIVCKINFCAITVDVWLFWAECNVDNVHNDRTLQNEISEAMYLCSEALKKVQDGDAEFPLAGELIAMLATLAVKPRDEDDEIREADIELIIKNVSDSSKSQRKWFKALLGLDEIIMSDERCVECLESNLHLAECEDVKVILEKIVTTFGAVPPDQQCNKIKHIGLDCLKHLSLEQQVDTVRWFFVTFGTSVSFLTDDFHLVATEVFNKAVKMTRKKDQFFSEFVSLCMQSPPEVVTKILHEGLTNPKQVPLMIEVLECLNPILSVYELDKMTAASGNEKMSIVTLLLSSVMKNDLSDLEKSNFVNFAVALVNRSIVDGSVFLRRCLLPALHENLSVRNWSQLLLWLETLHSFTDGTVTSCIGVPECPLLVVLAQVLEVSRWNILTFSAGAVAVCDEACSIVRSVMKTFLGTKATEDREVKWLQIKLDKFVSPLNKSYFSKLWTKFGREWASAPSNMIIFLLEAMQDDDFSRDSNRKAVENKEHYVLFPLSKVLPLCTAMEWKMLAKGMKILYMNKLESSVPLINIFADSVLLLLTVIKQKGIQENECVLSCLDYCIRNLGLILKDETVSRLKSVPTEDQVKIFIKILHVLGRLPPSIKDSCSIVMLNILIEFLPEVMNRSVVEKKCMNGSDEISLCSYVRDIATSIGVLGNGEPLQVLSRKMLECMVLNDAH